MRTELQMANIRPAGVVLLQGAADHAVCGPRLKLYAVSPWNKHSWMTQLGYSFLKIGSPQIIAS